MTPKFPFEQFLKWDNETPPAQGLPASFTNKPVSNKAAPPLEALADSDEGLGTDDLRLLGNEIKENLRSMLPAQAFSTYFSDTLLVSAIHPDRIEFTATTNFIKKIIETQYRPALAEAVRDTLGRDYQLEFKTFGIRTTSLSSNTDSILRTQESQQDSCNRKVSVKDNTFIITDLTPSAADKTKAVDSRVMEHKQSLLPAGSLDTLKKFSNFVVGPSNNLAHASALAVARDPGQIYPSLYIYGNSGLGKTHLIHAIANYIQEHRPHLRVVITSGNALMLELVETTQEKKGIDFFKKKYTQNVDVLIIDDIHGLKGKEGTQEQFFHIFNELTDRKKQLIFTSDKTPREIDRLEERIRTRLSSALIVEVQPADFETRIAILRAKAQDIDFFLKDEVVTLIARCVKSSIRDLEGCLTHLKAYSDFMKVDIDLELARSQLKLSDQIENQKQITPESITKTVAQYYRIPYGDIRGKSKTKEIVLARQVAMYLIHQHLRKTLSDIAHYFGKKDHTTPMYTLEVVRKRLKTDQQFAQQLLDIENQF